MAEEPVDLRLYFEAQHLLSPVLTNNPETGVNKSGSMYQPPLLSFPTNKYDEVYPNLYIGNKNIVKNYDDLKSIGITHIVNASMGPKFNQVDTSTDFYQQYDIEFHGIPAMDIPTFKIAPFLKDAAKFIEQALDSNGIVYVHCQQGVSRSATVVLAYLMIVKRMDLLSAIKLVRKKRGVRPNNGFLRELCQLQDDLNLNSEDS